jgi:hypothetical protein
MSRLTRRWLGVGSLVVCVTIAALGVVLFVPSHASAEENPDCWPYGDPTNPLTCDGCYQTCQGWLDSCGDCCLSFYCPGSQCADCANDCASSYNGCKWYCWGYFEGEGCPGPIGQ